MSRKQISLRRVIMGLSLGLVDLVKKTDQLSLYHLLKRTQWLPTAELEAMQTERLRQIVVHAYEQVPYYAKLFKKIEFNPYELRSKDEISAIPVLTKRLTRENSKLLRAANRQDYVPRLAKTSGSTGEPLVFDRDRMSHSVVWASNWRAFSVNGYEPGEPVFSLWGGMLMPNVTPRMNQLYFRLMGVTQLPAYHLSDESMDRYLRVIRKTHKSSYIYSYASAAYLFARHVLKSGCDDISFKGIFTTAEVLSPSERTVIETGLNSLVFDTYGNNEATLTAFECEKRNGLHYSMELAFLEVLNEKDETCGPGETGRLIATSLTNYAMPFIRYDTGDIGSISDSACACGRGLKRINQVLGRSRDFVITPSGRQVHGAFFNHFAPFYETSWIGRWYIRQEAIDHITISIWPVGPPLHADIEKMRRLLTQALGEEIFVDIVINSESNITPGGKQKVIESFLEIGNQRK